MVCQIINISQEGEEKKAIDKKLLLFEARVNERIGNSVIPFAKQLISLCPEFLYSYTMIRKKVDVSGVEIAFDPEDEHTDMLKAFVDKNISNQDFLKMLKRCDDEKSMRNLRRALLILNKRCDRNKLLKIGKKTNYAMCTIVIV